MTPGQLQVMMPKKKDAACGLVGSTHGTYTILENMDNHPVLGQGSIKLRLLPENITHRSALLEHHRWTETVFNISPEAFCRPVVRGYCLTLKDRGTFAVGNISDVKWNDNAFGALVTPPARKKILEALVKQQQVHKTDTEIDDVVASKGQGLVLLLPGPAGTGKTLTAESIADHLRIPLYAVSTAELGDTVAEIEAHFGQVSKLAASWNAVLLLDEADAFLEKRTDSPEARDRNKRVAAFLRILEYYKGILVLTTNRIVAFDDAFHCRIHLILPFKALDIPARKSVWTNFLGGAAIEDEDIDSFAAEELNGRQIKNIMKMAKLLAKEGGEDLQGKHIKVVMSVVKEAAEME
ncbi:Putative AAA+ ATPase domain, ATPase, AAA-type, core [Septoria linicola]|uniref:AAA+ ATPase domain, ATPase, AAA-type, core n=1 Tax=Septoria linicola TaxID=215465 RepID=A0A9Q9AYV7_9PEZI|nr:putative AAA+ ATPase domain, ATPase, AAA-type, core [Septoria linicola]USW58537.1 Putative AAA+ ATPase domain, ATPase, AAA-type, core [Septoria linicola]